MIGTLICRNCDTVFEVSEGDVSKFKVHPVFPCTVCQADLSPLMAGFVEGHSAAPEDPANEFTIPDDQEVFDGLPMGESFDQAAAKIREGTNPPTPIAPTRNRDLATTVRSVEPPLAARARPQAPPPEPAAMEPTPLMRNPDPTPIVGPEDPVQMALRLAAQAAQQAAAMATQPESTGVAIRWKPPAQPPANGAASTEIGVVPEEPDNEPTARGRGSRENSETTEPTMPSPEPSGEEPTPLLTTSNFSGAEMDAVADTADDEAIPDVTDDGPVRSTLTPEPTPAIRPLPPQFSEAPLDEPTIRKSSPPPAFGLVRPVLHRSGAGPASVGALGIRVVTSRPIVRPNANARGPAVSAGDTAISGSHAIPRFEPARTPSSGTRAPAPAPSVDTVLPPPARPAKPAVPAMLLAVVGTLTVGLLVIVGWALSHRKPVAAETPTPTPVVEASEPAPTATAEVGAPTVVPRHTPGIAATSTPQPVASRTIVAAVPSSTPLATRTAVAATPTPPPTPRPTQVALVTPRTVPPTPVPGMKPESTKALADAAVFDQNGQSEEAYKTIRAARMGDSNNELLNFYYWKYAHTAKKDEEAVAAAKFYLQHHSKGPHASIVQIWLSHQPATP